MCVKFPLGDLNLNPCPPHPRSTYICRVTIVQRVRDGKNSEREKISRKLNKETRQLSLVYHLILVSKKKLLQ